MYGWISAEEGNPPGKKAAARAMALDPTSQWSGRPMPHASTWSGHGRWTRSPIFVAVVGLGYARAGRVEDAQRLLNELDDRASRGEYVPAFTKLAIYLGLGDLAAVRRELASAVDEIAPIFSVRGTTGVLLDALSDDPEIARLYKVLYPTRRSTRVPRPEERKIRLATIRHGLTGCLLLALLATPGVSQDAAKAQAPVGWIRAHAIPLKTVEAGHGFDDMVPIEEIVGDARVVALGEATHGTREFFQLKHRMVEFLATRMGFTIFTIEANMPEAYRLNDYGLHGTADPRALLRGMYFWTWQTEEVLAMIEWMRAFNESGKGRIEFTGFDMQTPTVAAEIVRTYVAQHDPPYLQTLDPVWQDVARAQPSSGGAFGVGTATFPVQVAAGHTIIFTGYIRTENVTRGFAGLWWRIDGEKGDDGRAKILGFDNMADRGARGTTPWTKYEIEMPVPTGATNINFGVLHPGNGSAWFDSLNVEIDGAPYRDASTIDLDFESDSPRGFYTGGQGYQVAIDKAISHTGKQSLRSTAVAESTGQSAPDPKQLAAGCSKVVQHLEDRRPGVGGDTERLKELDWVIQNARVVLQYAQLSAGIKTRDESMADNIRWIADQNPGARIIVWAHNWHIAHGGMPSNTPMGVYLRRAFGSRYVNFGFAFNQGSFRAVEMGKGLHDFSVGPAPDGSLDATLASAGVPIMALDLRQHPKPPAVNDWLTTAHRTRGIGAVYSEEQAANYFFDASAPEMFDALLFVEKTTAARAIAP